MSYKILDVELTKSTLAVKEQFIIRVSIGTWDFVGKNYSWKNLYDLKKWGDLIGGYYPCKNYSTAGYRYEQSCRYSGGME